MKTKVILCSALLIGMVLTFSAADASATAISENEAWIDWSSLQCTGSFTWGTKNSSSSAEAQDEFNAYVDDSDSESAWTYTSASASVLLTSGNAYTDDDELYTEADTTLTYPTTWGYSDASVSRTSYITATANGWITFSVDYGFWQDLSTECTDELSQGGAIIKLSLRNYGENKSVDDTQTYENTVKDGDSLIDLTDDGTLTVSYWFNSGQQGYFWAQANSYTWVETPEPTTLGLLAVGGLTLLRRKRK